MFNLLAGSWDDEILKSELRDAERWLSDPSAREYFWNVLRSRLTVSGMKPEWLLLERLRELRIPVLVAWGRKDRLLPISNVEKIRSRLPEARYELLDDAGHMLPYEAAEPFNSALIDFLRGD